MNFDNMRRFVLGKPLDVEVAEEVLRDLGATLEHRERETRPGRTLSRPVAVTWRGVRYPVRWGSAPTKLEDPEERIPHPRAGQTPSVEEAVFAAADRLKHAYATEAGLRRAIGGDEFDARVRADGYQWTPLRRTDGRYVAVVRPPEPYKYQSTDMFYAWTPGVVLFSTTTIHPFPAHLYPSAAERKSEAARRKAVIGEWRAAAEALLTEGQGGAEGEGPGLDTVLRDALVRYTKGVALPAKLAERVYDAIKLSPEERAVLAAAKASATYEPRPAWNAPPAEHEAWEERAAVRQAAVKTGRDLEADLRRRAARLGGFELPEETEARKAWEIAHGYYAPPRPTGYKLGAWTCSGCFTVHAVTIDGGVVHHGYTRPGDGRIHGDCIGVGWGAWEREVGAAPEVLDFQEQTAARLVGALRRGFSALRDPLDDKVWIDATHPRWARAVETARANILTELRYLWAPRYMGIPWLRAAIRTWSQSDMGPVGAPEPTMTPADHEGRPAEIEELGDFAEVRRVFAERYPDHLEAFDAFKLDVLQMIAAETPAAPSEGGGERA